MPPQVKVTIGHVANSLDIHAQTIRRWEADGVLGFDVERFRGKRVFTLQQIETLQRIIKRRRSQRGGVR